MPIVHIDLLEGRSQEQKRNLVREVTKAICETVNVAPEQVRIVLSEMAPEHYAIAGTLILDKQK